MAMPVINSLDFGAAIEQRRRNDLLKLQEQAAAAQLKETQDVEAIRARTAQGQGNLANELESAGYSDKANALRAQYIQTKMAGLQYIAQTAPRITDQASYDKALFDWQENKLVAPGELPSQYDPNLVSRLGGAASKELQVLTKNLPGRMAQQYLRQGNSVQPWGEPYSLDKPTEGLPSGMRMGADGKPEWIPGYIEGKKAVSKAGATSVTVAPSNKKFYEKLGENEAKALDEAHTAATSARDETQAIDQAAKLVDKGIIAGSGANARLGFGRLLATIGFGTGDEVARTDAFIASTAGMVGKVLSSGMMGSGSSITERDVEFVKGMVGGSIQLTPQSIRKIMDIRRRASKDNITLYNDMLKAMKKKYPEMGEGGVYAPVLFNSKPKTGGAGFNPPAPRPSDNAAAPQIINFEDLP